MMDEDRRLRQFCSMMCELKGRMGLLSPATIPSLAHLASLAFHREGRGEISVQDDTAKATVVRVKGRKRMLSEIPIPIETYKILKHVKYPARLSESDEETIRTSDVPVRHTLMIFVTEWAILGSSFPSSREELRRIGITLDRKVVSREISTSEVIKWTCPECDEILTKRDGLEIAHACQPEPRPSLFLDPRSEEKSPELLKFD